MQRLRDMSDIIIDTTLLSSKELRIAIADRMISNFEKSHLMQISVVSFVQAYKGEPDGIRASGRI